MMDIESRLHEGDRVRIRDYVDPGIYAGMSTIGNEGLIKKVDKDKWGLPKVFIEWDKNHWTYNGAPDGWTFEDHFDIVESAAKVKESSMDQDDKKKAFALLAQIMGIEESQPETQTVPETATPQSSILDRLNARVAKQLGDESPMPEVTPTDPDPVDERTQSIADAASLIENAEAFIVVAVNKVTHANAPKGVLVPMSILYNDNQIAELVAAVHISHLASEAFQDIVLGAIQSE
jgi:hypothetical protein